MMALNFDFPPPHVERQVLTSIYGVNEVLADELVRLAQAIRQLQEPGLSEAASTRALVAAGRLAKAGLPKREAAHAAIASALSDDSEVVRQLAALIDTYLA
jgi:nitric oxide reductase NorQ protein